jgi:hypothetical protein
MSTVERPRAAWHLPALGGVAVVLTALAALVGSVRWPTPTRTTSGWQVADVAPSLLVAVAGTGLACLVVAALVMTPRTLGSPLVAATWWATAVASVAAQVWNDLYFAAMADTGGIIPVSTWLFTFVPALVVGLVARRHGPAAHRRALAGIAVVTQRMLALGWALAAQSERLWHALASGLHTAVFFGVLPLVAAAHLTRVRR